MVNCDLVFQMHNLNKVILLLIIIGFAPLRVFVLYIVADDPTDE